MFTRCSFNKEENKLNCYREKDCIEKLCNKLKELAMEIINYEEKEMVPLTHEENKYHICQKSFASIKMMKIIKIENRLKIIVITQENLEELLIVNAI